MKFLVDECTGLGVARWLRFIVVTEKLVWLAP